MSTVSIGLGTGVEPRIRLSPHSVSSQRGDNENPSSVRRGSAVRRSRRGLLIRFLKPALAALALVTGPSAAVAWLMVSPRFAVRELAVVTGDRVTDAWVRQALAPLIGENLPRLPLARAEQLLHAHPWVRGADLRKDLPARLAVRVTERHAIALLRAGDDLFYLDSEGSRIAPCDPVAESADLPLISIMEPRLTESQALNVRATPAAAISAAATPSATLSQPDHGRGEPAGLASAAVRLLSEIDETGATWAAGLSEIEVLGEEDFRLHTSVLPFPVLVRAGTMNQRARRLEQLLPRIVERYGAVAAVDLRFTRRIIVQPSVEAEDGLSRLVPIRPDPPGSNLSRPAAMTEYREATTDHAQRG